MKSVIPLIIAFGALPMIYILIYAHRAIQYSGAYNAYKSLTGQKLSKLNTIYGDTTLVSGMPESKDMTHNLKQGYVYHHVLTFTNHDMILIYYKHRLKPHMIKIPYSHIKKWFYHVITTHESHGSVYMSCDIYVDLERGCLEFNELKINNHTGSRFIDILNEKTNPTQQITPSYNKQTIYSLLHYGKFIRHLVNEPQHQSDFQQRKQIKDHVDNAIRKDIDQSYYLNN